MKNSIIFRSSIIFLLLANLIIVTILLALINKSLMFGPNSFYESIGVLSLAKEMPQKSGVPLDSLLLEIGEKKFSSWNLDEQRSFLIYNALTDANLNSFRSILVRLATDNGLLSIWQYDLEIMHDNCEDPLTRHKCAAYINAIKEQNMEQTIK